MASPGKEPMNVDPREEVSKKRKVDEASSSQTLALVAQPPSSEASKAADNAKSRSELVPRDIQRISLEFNPQFLRRLKERNEFGFRRPAERRVLTLTTFEIEITAFRNAMKGVLRATLYHLYQADIQLRRTQMIAEIDRVVNVTSDMCMTALYAKLRNVHKAFGRHGTRYPSAPSYSKDVELPLPLALAIQDFGSFETHCLTANHTLAPTYPEGIANEGRERAEYPLVEYQSYLPILKARGIPCKSIDSRIKTGSAWWTYKVENHYRTSDLVMILPPIHYSDLSAQIRALFLFASNNECAQIIKLPAETSDYGTRLKEMKPGSNVRTFHALCHGPEEDWSFGAV